MNSQNQPNKSKTDAIREYLPEHPNASNEEVAEALRKQGYDISKKYVSTIRSKLGLSIQRSPEEERSIVCAPKKVGEAILMEVYRRGSRAEIGDNRKPGKDRDLYDKVADVVGVMPQQRQLRNKRGRYAWDYTISVAVQQLIDPKRAGKNKRHEDMLLVSVQRGCWELTRLGRREAERLLRGQAR